MHWLYLYLLVGRKETEQFCQSGNMTLEEELD